MLSSGARLAVCRWNKRRSIFSAIPCRTTCPTGAAGVTVGMARTGCSVKPMTPSRRWVRLSYRRNSSKTRRSLQSSSVLAATACKTPTRSRWLIRVRDVKLRIKHYDLAPGRCDFDGELGGRGHRARDADLHETGRLG